MVEGPAPQQLKSMYLELSSLDTAQRRERLRGLEHTHPALFRQLQRLFDSQSRLAGREQALEALSDAAVDLVDSLAGAGHEPVLPGQIDRYRIIQVLGEGGMGRVYKAEQLEPVQRQVALKLTRSALDPASVLARFQAERQALAVLDHAHIARVYDAGSTADGCPWFAMELVDGVPITLWARQRRLSLRQRVQLFLPVLDAVQHAHRKGLIHRDLKPSNLLVVDDGGLGAAKVIDFGIAKVIHSDHQGDDGTEAGTDTTRAGELLGTPEYMSPEQASLGEIDIDTRCDVYALGMVLYELLADGLPPAVMQLRQRSFGAMCREIREQALPRASAVVAADPARSLGTGTRPDWLRALRRDLDHVLAKAVAKDREQRYGSVADLAADLHRFLDDVPVLATAPGWRYRAGKFLRRHRLPVLAAALVTLALLAGMIMAGIGLWQARQAATLAERERNAAQAATGFMVELFRASDPRNNPGLELTARELLDRGLERLAQLDDQPQVQAELLGALGDVYWMLGASDQAEPLLRRALALWQSDTADSALKQVSVLNRLAGLLRDRNQYDEAEALFRQALEVLHGQRPPGSPEEVTLLNNLGIVLIRSGQLDQAEQVYQRAIDLMHGHVREDPDAHKSWSSSMANLFGNLAHLQSSRGDVVKAAASARRSLAIVSEQLPADHPNLAIQNSNLAFLLAAQGELGPALAHARRAVAINQVALAPGHPTAAAHLLNLGRVELRLGHVDDAIAHLGESVHGYRSSHGEDTYDATRPLAWLALAHLLRGEAAQAIAHADEVVSLLQAADHPSAQRDLAAALRRQAFIHQRAGGAADAQAAARQALAVAEALQRPDDQALAHLLLAVLEPDPSVAGDHWQQANALADCGEAQPCILDKADELVIAADWWLRLGEQAQALQALQRAVAHPGWCAWLLDGADRAALHAQADWDALASALARRRAEATAAAGGAQI